MLRTVHLLRRAFEQATTTANKQGVATKQYRLAIDLCGAEISQVVEGVARHGQHVKGQPLPDNFVTGVNR